MILPDLIARCKKDDASAQEMLVNKYHRRALGYCMSLLNDIHDAQETMWKMFMTVLTDIKRFDERTEDAFEKWIFTIIKNGCLATIKSRAKYNDRLSIVDSVPEMAMADETESEVYGYHLYDCLRQIKYHYRVVIILKVIEEMPHNEIAVYLKITTESSRVYYSIGISQLRKLININQL